MLVALADASNETFTAEVWPKPLEMPPELGRQPHGGANGTHPVLPVDVPDHTRAPWRTNSIQAAGDRSRRKVREPGTSTIASENSFPRLLQPTPASPWWDDAATEETEGIADIAATALTRKAHADLRETPWAMTRPPGVTTGCTRSRTGTPWQTSLYWDPWLSVGPFELGAAKDALCKYEFKLKKEVDYSIFSGPSMRIGIDFADVDAAESILPTGQSGNVFSDFYDNQAPLYHAGRFRQMRMNRADIEAHTIARSTITP